MSDGTEFVSACLREAFGPEAVPDYVERIAAGRHDLWRMQMTVERERLRLVLRRFTHPFTWHSSHDGVSVKAEREYAALAHVAPAGLPAPAPRAHGPDWTLVDEIAGHDLTSSPVNHDAHIAAARSLATVLARLHALPVPDGPFPRVTTESTIATLREWARTLGYQRLQQAVSRLRPLAEISPVLVHGDPHYHNMLFDDEYRVAGLFDWEDAAIADYRFDAAIAVWFLRRHLERGQAVAESEPCFVEAYEAASGRRIDDLAQWLAFNNIRSWAVADMMRAAGYAMRSFRTDEEKTAAERALTETGF